MINELDNQSDFLFYRSDEGSLKVKIIVGEDTVWTSQAGMAEIFNSSKQNISYHILNIFESGELERVATVKEILTVQIEGDRKVNRKVEVYNLDMIIAVGYRVSSYQATQFRIWATKVLKEYLIKGFALDDERLKQGNNLFSKDYFSELLERIREIRASERRFYQKITDLYTTAIDYDKNSPLTQEFYATVQNKLHWAIHNHTAAELIAQRSDASKPNMGLTTWKNADNNGNIVKSDVSVAKNYLNQEEIGELNRVVSMYLDYAENMAARGKALKMLDWIKKLDSFLEFNEYSVLTNTGKISSKVAKTLAEKQYEKFRPIQDREYKSDFDKTVESIKMTGSLPSNESEPKEDLSSFNKSLSKTLKHNTNKRKPE